MAIYIEKVKVNFSEEIICERVAITAFQYNEDKIFLSVKGSRHYCSSIFCEWVLLHTSLALSEHE